MSIKRKRSMVPDLVGDGELNFEREDGGLSLHYVLVDDLVLLDGNPKLHDMGKLSASIVENGFRDPPSWDETLNDGKGGLVEGNGRAECLKMMQDQGQAVPRGIATNSQGLWAVPVLFGCNAHSENAAKRYSIDHNNLTLSGGSFTALDMSRMYRADLYIPFLEGLAKSDDLPGTIDGDDLDLLIKLQQEGGLNFDSDIPHNGDDELENKNAGSKKEQGNKSSCTCPNCGFVFDP